tara:strand:- start:74 stop:250 length:177 start_codon:yes stop_codon:yes gene_type:complete
MIDGVILMGILIPVIMVVFTFFLDIVTSTGGTKGITQPYITKSGEVHTAKKSRENHIV